VPELIDIHTHWCLFGRNLEEVLVELECLEAAGYDAVVVFPLPGMGAPPEAVVDVIPGAYRVLIGMNVERAVHDDLEAWRRFEKLWNEREHTMEVLSFLDVRAWDGEADLSPWWGDGHAGLKGIMIVEEDAAKMDMPALRHAPGLSRAAYLDAQRAVFGAAGHYGVPLTFHADLSQHGGFVTECLEEHPGLRVDIPHFGFSRRAMAGLLDRFPGTMTDVSSMGPHLESAPESYRSFILDHPDRVMLGSDVIASHDLREALGYVDRVRALGLPAEVEAAVLGGNARRFLQG
jgi:hypothetical protein